MQHNLTPARFNFKADVLKNRNKVYILYLYALSPFFALIVAIKNYKASWAKNVVWLFVAFYGYTMVILREGMDANRYKNWFLQMGQSDITFNSFIDLLYNEKSNYVDIFQPLITFVVSRFTTEYEVLFLVFALIFGYFYSRNIWFLLENAGTPLKKESILLLITFSFIVGFWEINGFRMWTAAHIFFYGATQYLYKGNRKGVLIAILTIFVHFSFILPVLILLIFTVFKNYIHLYFWIFIGTFFISEIDLEFIREALINIAPDFLTHRVKSYTNEEYAASIKMSSQARNWYAQYYMRTLKWVSIAFITLIYFKSLDFIKNDRSIFSLYTFSLLFMAVANITSLVPSGARFLAVASLFAVSTIFFYIQSSPKIKFIRKLMPFATIALILFCVVALRIGFDTIGLMTILGNPFLALFMDFEIALIELIK